MKIYLAVACAVVLTCIGCSQRVEVQEQSRGGVKAASVSISTGSDGLTTEQRNVAARLKLDNKPGVIKHLYVLSAYSGQAIFYSTVKGKVTSSGKRLTPYQELVYSGNGNGGWSMASKEKMQDDGTYGSSVEYIYWLDARDVYHQHYISGGQIVHISTEPMPIKSVIVNIEATNK